jgi:hypothetical protein
MCIELGDLLKEACADNAAGLAQEHYFAAVEDIATWPILPPSPATLAESVTTTGDFTFAVGKGFLRLYATLKTGQLVSAGAGENQDSQAITNTATLYHPGNGADLLGFVNQAKGQRFVFLIVEANGQKRILGTQLSPANVEEINVTTGTNPGDAKGATFNVTSFPVIAPVYTGEIIFPNFIQHNSFDNSFDFSFD